MPSVALYARVSTRDQHPEAQIERLREYASAAGLSVCGEFVDHAASGASSRRPQYQRLMQLARARKLEAVAVVKLDRWGRSMQELVNSTVELTELGVRFIAADQGIDLATSTGRMQFQMLAAIAEFERELIRERTLDGLEAARRRGAKLGPKFSSRITPGEARRAQEDGLSIRETAERYGVGVATVHRALRRGVPQSPPHGAEEAG